MAVTVTKIADPVTADERHSFGDLYGVLATVLFDSSYPNAGGGDSGEPVTPQDFGLDDHIEAVIPLGAGGAKLVEYDSERETLKVYVTATGVEAADASDQSAVTATVLVLGK
jgi:hypothetical protein